MRHRNHAVGNLLLWVALTASVLASSIIAWNSQLTPNVLYGGDTCARYGGVKSPDGGLCVSDQRYATEIYSKPWTRASSYLIGIGACLLCQRLQEQPREPREPVFTRPSLVLAAAVVFFFFSLVSCSLSPAEMHALRQAPHG